MKLKHVNTLLLAAIIVVNLYIAIAPLLPALTANTPVTEARKQELQAKVHSAPAQAAVNSLIVPVLGMEQPIQEGRDLRAATNGPWRLPHTSSPDHGGNTVIVGHRFTYTQPRGAFYHLNKLKPGDAVAVTWNKKVYRYKVSNPQVVPATRTSVEAQTKESVLTLYTCTPLWWPKDRLVITAALEGVSP